MTVLRELLGGAVDYAGLFPPASLDMTTAVANYAAYRAGDDRWMLGRFVVPGARLDELRRAMDHHGELARRTAPWPVSAVIGGDVAMELARVRDTVVAHGEQIAVDSIEARLGSVEEIEGAVGLAPPRARVFVELPFDERLEVLLDAVARLGACGKVRTGGVTADAFPSPGSLVHFMRACRERGVPFKATAGLHHPLRGEYALTYAPDSARGPMYGFLNVLLAAALIADGASDAEAGAMLVESSANAVGIDADGIRWRDQSIGTEAIRRARADVMLSFGSCSFREPVEELGQLGFRA